MLNVEYLQFEWHGPDDVTHSTFKIHHSTLLKVFIQQILLPFLFVLAEGRFPGSADLVFRQAFFDLFL